MLLILRLLLLEHHLLLLALIVRHAESFLGIDHEDIVEIILIVVIELGIGLV